MLQHYVCAFISINHFVTKSKQMEKPFSGITYICINLRKLWLKIFLNIYLRVITCKNADREYKTIDDFVSFKLVVKSYE